MEAVDTYIPEPERAIDLPFLMPIEDVFSITGRGTVVTGRVERGMVKTGEEIEIVGLRPTTKTVCTGVEMFRKILDEGRAGDNIGALLRGTKKEEVERGQVLAKPGSITPHTQFNAQVYVLTKEEGGRHTPFFANYHPQFYFRTTDVTGSIALPEGVEMVMPGDNTEMMVELQKPIAMDEGLRFAIREGGRTVGSGVVTERHQVAAQPRDSAGSRRDDVARWQTSKGQKIRIRLKAYDHEIDRPVDEEDRGDGRAHAGEGARPGAAAHRDPALLRRAVAARRQGLPRALRDADPQAPARHRRAHQQDGRVAPAPRPPRRRRASRSRSKPLIAPCNRSSVLQRRSQLACGAALLAVSELRYGFPRLRVAGP